ncbi:DUF3800 domain-containing protein [Paenibacillus sp. SYP-B3998]|uniref:DUF3800 domain-containing protein n=1 Tax=Paenibacillus sp. SYP-B3998 TaxID=2678564 RepID=A0A6G4A148_9BACL|nr:DUF3800 domain-containing protein [Paenibacillus sp. SYP-B3998]NEW07367.1 DUF3800 domain-containing protein [Paenibacillus sp. SYP-B3998]
MRKKYSLYLDEILTGGHFDHFCLVGFAVSTEDYETKIIPELNQIKQDFFGDTSVIIHEMEIQKHKSSTPFKIFQNNKKYEEFWERIKSLFQKYDLPIFAVCIHEVSCQKLYSNSRDKYFIALQVILENFVHFLEKSNGVGNIYVESTDANPHQKDEQLQYHFHYLKANGTLFYDKRVIQNRVGTISFPLKVDNIVGLQIADLLPNSLNRKLSNKDQRTHGLIDVIEKKAYDGRCGKQERFGIKIIP